MGLLLGHISNNSKSLSKIFRDYNPGSGAHFGPGFFIHRPFKWGQIKRNNVSFKVMANKNPFNITRSEFANKLDISTDTLKKRMKRGQYKDQYIFENGKYFFSSQETVRPIIGQSPGTNVPRKRNRGNHFKGDYPNLAFQQKNELRMLAKLKHNVDEEVQDLLPEAVQIAKNKKLERLQSSLREQPKGMLKHYGTPLINMSNKGYGTVSYSSPIAHRFEPSKFRENIKPKKIDWSKKYY
jgi:hypothetical protein